MTKILLESSMPFKSGASSVSQVSIFRALWRLMAYSVETNYMFYMKKIEQAIGIMNSYR